MADTLGSRLRSIRKELRLTQAEFGAKIGVHASTITNYEANIRQPSDAIIMSICLVYGLDETWLRTGVGVPFRQRTREEEIDSYLASVLHGENESFRRRFSHALAKLDVSDWELLVEVAEKIAKEGGPD